MKLFKWFLPNSQRYIKNIFKKDFATVYMLTKTFLTSERAVHAYAIGIQKQFGWGPSSRQILFSNTILNLSSEISCWLHFMEKYLKII